MTRYHKGERLHYTSFYGAYSKRCVVLEVHRNTLHRSPRHCGSTTPHGDQTLYLLDCGNERVWATSPHLTHEPYEANEDLIQEQQMLEQGDVVYDARLNRFGIVVDVKVVLHPLPWSHGDSFIKYYYTIMVGLERQTFPWASMGSLHIYKSDGVVS